MNISKFNEFYNEVVLSRESNFIFEKDKINILLKPK